MWKEKGSAGILPALSGILPESLFTRTGAAAEMQCATRLGNNASGRDAGRCGLEARAPQDKQSRRVGGIVLVNTPCLSRSLSIVRPYGAYAAGCGVTQRVALGWYSSAPLGLEAWTGRRVYARQVTKGLSGILPESFFTHRCSR